MRWTQTRFAKSNNACKSFSLRDFNCLWNTSRMETYRLTSSQTISNQSSHNRIKSYGIQDRRHWWMCQTINWNTAQKMRLFSCLNCMKSPSPSRTKTSMKAVCQEVDHQNQIWCMDLASLDKSQSHRWDKASTHKCKTVYYTNQVVQENHFTKA